MPGSVQGWIVCRNYMQNAVLTAEFNQWVGRSVSQSVNQSQGNHSQGIVNFLNTSLTLCSIPTQVAVSHVINDMINMHTTL